MNMTLRSGIAVSLALLLCCGIAHAQDVQKLDAEKAKKFAVILADAAAKLPDRPLAVTPDNERGVGLEKQKHGVLLVPDAKLSLDALKKLDKEILPLGM